MGGFVLLFSAAICGSVILPWIWRLFYLLWWRPMTLMRHLKHQGISVLPYKFVVGNMVESVQMEKEAQLKPMDLSHAIVPRVMPFLHGVVKNYGKVSVFWFGANPRLCIMDPQLLKEVLSDNTGRFQKPKQGPVLSVLITGLLMHEGPKWVKHRRVLNPAFHQEKLKRMQPAFLTSCRELISRWSGSVGSEASYELDVWTEFQNFTGDVISRTAFGSSYKQGMRIFQLQMEQTQLFSKSIKSIFIPGYRFLPTQVNRRRNEIDREVCSLLKAMIEEREEEMKTRNLMKDDLLGLLMQSNFNDSQEQGSGNGDAMTIEEMIKECKLFYFAGQETTAVLLTWTIVALCMHPRWQEEARKEVLRVFGQKEPDFDGLNNLKVVNMILLEVLRLYPPVILTARCVRKLTKLGDFTLPAGADVALPVLLVHHDPEIWGEDVEEFKPERFAEGISKATKNQVVFIPFGWGPRICIGQNFAMIEVKITLAMILQNFSFELSSSYAHAPSNLLTLTPQHGAQLVFRRL